MRLANGASVPIFLAAVPASGLAALATGESGGATGRLALSELGALGVVATTKLIVNRARPFVTLPDVTSRQRRPPGGLDPYSFPSGHSAMAFALATSTSLSYPEWYVIVPAYLWAGATATARIWFGMHYASDTVIGAAVGAGTAALVHAIFAGDPDEEGLPGTAAVPVFTLRVGL
jgi:membrane-associated phospholipid phosphatase